MPATPRPAPRSTTLRPATRWGRESRVVARAMAEGQARVQYGSASISPAVQQAVQRYKRGAGHKTRRQAQGGHQAGHVRLTPSCTPSLSDHTRPCRHHHHTILHLQHITTLPTSRNIQVNDLIHITRRDEAEGVRQRLGGACQARCSAAGANDKALLKQRQGAQVQREGAPFLGSLWTFQVRLILRVLGLHLLGAPGKGCCSSSYHNCSGWWKRCG